MNVSSVSQAAPALVSFEKTGKMTIHFPTDANCTTVVMVDSSCTTLYCYSVLCGEITYNYVIGTSRLAVEQLFCATMDSLKKELAESNTECEVECWFRWSREFRVGTAFEVSNEIFLVTAAKGGGYRLHIDVNTSDETYFIDLAANSIHCQYEDDHDYTPDGQMLLQNSK